MIVLTKETNLPVCEEHAEENGIKPVVSVPYAVAPNPSGEPADTFITFETPS